MNRTFIILITVLFLLIIIGLSIALAIVLRQQKSSVTLTSFHNNDMIFPQNWGARYKDRLANASSTLVRIAVIGDSVTAGSYVSSQYPNASGTSYTSILRSVLQEKYGFGGSGFTSVSQSQIGFGNTPYAPSVTPFPIRATGSWYTLYQQYAAPASCYISSTLMNDYVDMYTSGKNIVLTYMSGPVADFSSSASITITDNNTGMQVTPIVSTLNTQNSNVTMPTCSEIVLANNLSSTGEYTVRITNNDANKALAICGIAGVNDVGVTIDIMAMPGQSAYIIDQTKSWTLSSNSADLVIFALGLNDTDTTTNAQWSQLLQNAAAAFKGKDVMFLALPLAGYSETWRSNNVYGASHIDLSKAFATDMGYSFLNLDGLTSSNFDTLVRMQYLSTGTGPSGSPMCLSTPPPGTAGASSSTSNAVHPGDTGNKLIAWSILPFLDP